MGGGLDVPQVAKEGKGGGAWWLLQGDGGDKGQGGAKVARGILGGAGFANGE